MKRIAKSAFADMAGISRSRVAHNIKAGHIVVRPDGKIDLSHPTNVNFLEVRQMRQNQGGAQQSRNLPPMPPRVRKTPDDSASSWPEEIAKIDCMDTEALRRLPRDQIAELKDIQGIRHREQKIREQRGELIDRELVRRVLAKYYSVHVNEFQTLGDSIAPDVAATLGVNDESLILGVEKMINDAMFRRLQSIKKIIDDFLKEIA